MSRQVESDGRKDRAEEGQDSSSGHAQPEMDDASKTKRFSPILVGRPPSPRTNDSSPRIVGRSPLASPALIGLGSRLDSIPEHDHTHDPTSGVGHVGQVSASSPLREPPPLALGPTFSSGSISSLESGSMSSGLPPPVIREESADEASLAGTDVDTIGPSGESDATVDQRDREPVTLAEVLDTRTKGKRRLSVSLGLDKIKSLMGKGRVTAAPESAATSRSSSRRSSMSSTGPGPTWDWKNASPVLSPGSVKEGVAGILIRKDENVLKLTRPESLSPIILNRPTARGPTRPPTPPDISISTFPIAVDIDSSTPTPGNFLKSSVSDVGPGFVPAPSPCPSLTAESDPYDLTPTLSRTMTPTANMRPGNMTAVYNATSSPASPQQSRRTSLTNPAILKTRSFDEEAQNLMLNALQRGSGNHGLSLSRSSTKESTTTGSKPGVGGALAALGFKTAAAVGGPESVKKSNVNVILPSQPVGSDSPVSAPGVSLTAATPMMEQEEASPTSYFGHKRHKHRSSRSANKEEKYRRSLSPFFKGRRSISRGNANEKRDPSPPVGALSDAGESDGESVVSNSSSRFKGPQATAFSLSRRRAKNDSDEEDDDQGSDEGDVETDTEYDDDALSHEVVGPDGWVEDVFDPQTEENTKANAVYYEGDAAGLGGEGVLEDDDGKEIEVEVDALGEGPNVVIPPEPLFPQPSMMRRPATPPADHRGLASIVHKEKTKPRPLPLTTSRPEFGRNRCTVKLTQGDPDAALEESGNRLRSYVVLSDLSAEAGYAIEWCIGTVARDGDEIFLVSVMENEAKVDPKDHGSIDKAQKLRIQRERQATAAALARQVTSLLQRTVLNVSVTCQAIHSKNARHMLLDLIDYLEPTMVIVGSRGLGKLQGILLGSTSHYLVQKSSVPVMVARRRLKRPLRKTDPATLRHAPRTSLASASIEKQASTKQEDEVLDAEDVDREADRQEFEDRREREQRGRTMGGQGEVTL